MAQLRVLLVDDAAIIRTVVRRLLVTDGRFDVVGEATNGRDAIEAARVHAPDLVLLDLAMPEMDGLEALPHIRSVSPKSRVIVLSAFTPDSMAAAAVDAGALSYLEKSHLATKLIPHIVATLTNVLLETS